MDYKRLYKEIIDNAVSENRKKGEGVYYESHHIIPEFMFINRRRKGPKGHLEGNPECDSNKVLLTFSEHLMSHYYLYETLKSSRYGYSAGSSLQFFFTKASNIGHARQVNLSEIDIGLLEEMSHLREIGIESISNARKGKMPAVDAITREVIGSVPIDHPKVISGEWVHHSKGKVMSEDQRKILRVKNSGNGNPNYKEMTEDRRERVFACLERVANGDNLVKKKDFLRELKLEFSQDFKKISEVWITNNFGSFSELIEVVNQHKGKCYFYNRVPAKRRNINEN